MFCARRHRSTRSRSFGSSASPIRFFKRPMFMGIIMAGLKIFVKTCLDSQVVTWHKSASAVETLNTTGHYRRGRVVPGLDEGCGVAR